MNQQAVDMAAHVYLKELGAFDFESVNQDLQAIYVFAAWTKLPIMVAAKAATVINKNPAIEEIGFLITSKAYDEEQKRLAFRSFIQAVAARYENR